MNNRLPVTTIPDSMKQFWGWIRQLTELGDIVKLGNVSFWIEIEQDKTLSYCYDIPANSWDRTILVKDLIAALILLDIIVDAKEITQ